MSNYIRNQQSGATYFFTINLLNRKNLILIKYINELRQAYLKVQDKHPFYVDAMVVLPDHIHALWTLPVGDKEYPERIKLFKSHFTRQLPHSLKHTLNKSRQDKIHFSTQNS